MNRLALSIPLLALALGWAGTATTAQAQDAATPLVLGLPSSTRAMALGGAFMLSGGGSDAVFYNPAALAEATGIQLDVQRYGSATELAALSGVTEWYDGRIGLGVQVVSYGRPLALGALVPREEELFEGGTIAATELAATVGYAREVWGMVVGAAGKVIERRAGGVREVSTLVDVGATRELGPVTFGLAVQDLGPEPGIDDPEVPLSPRTTIGASVPREEVGPLDIGAAATVARLLDGTVVAGGGVEVAWWPVVGRTFIGRLGVRTAEGGGSPFTFGAAFLGDAIAIEYAYRPFEGTDGTHRIALGWR